ncbi:putative PurR-regulated permease PerM [Kibdelosporangium banguiense]|uniref:PurR-regulated permease PerM n=1 Tax=Kibdelosporangium banguiense TaxID=1365924 RepID=A0ABS4TKS1_9PSEU|nr:putative PurR-regulated permease PerM [Kibdelosporangium banguiense]
MVILLGTAAAVVTVAGVRTTAWLVTPILLALVIVIAVSPVHRRLRRAGFPAWAATLVLVLLVYSTLITFVVVAFVSLAQLTATLPAYADRFNGIIADVAAVLDRLGVAPAQVRDALASLDFGKIAPYLGSIIRDLTGLSTSLVFLLALLLFLSIEATGVEVRLAAITTGSPQAASALRSFAGRTRRYLVVTTIFGLIIAVLDTIALALLNIPLAVLWGLLSFVTNYIPNIGFLMGLVPPAALALLSGGWQLMLIVILIYCAVNFVVQSLIQPIYVGDSIGLSPVMTFVALVFWAWVLGPLGTLLAIPATLLVMAVLVDIDPGANWAAALTRHNKMSSAKKRHTTILTSQLRSFIQSRTFGMSTSARSRKRM